MIAQPSITQADVAKAAGVSTASVSRVLNQSPLVTPNVRARVEAAIKALGYVPHEAARALALRRTHVIGAIIPTLNNAIFAAGISALEVAVRERGYTLLLSVSNYDLEEERRLIRKMIERGVEGMMLVGNDHLAESFEELRSAGVRHLCAWVHKKGAPAANVGFSNAEAMTDLVDHLVWLGHRKIGMLAGLTATNDRARQRVLGVRERLAHHDLRLPDEDVIEIPYSIRAARRAFPDVMARGVTAVVCGNDVLAIGALFEAQAMGLDVPGDVSITGFDNLNLSSELNPPITTVDVPGNEMGKTVAMALIDAIEGDCDVESHALETALLVRGTTGPAPDANAA